MTPRTKVGSYWNVFRALFFMWHTDWRLYLQHGPLQIVQTRPTNNRIVSTVKYSLHMHRPYTHEHNFITFGCCEIGYRSSSNMQWLAQKGREVHFFSCSISALRWQWAINTMPRPLSSRKTDKVPILEEAGRAPGPA